MFLTDKNINLYISTVYEIGTLDAEFLASAPEWSGADDKRDFAMTYRFETAQRFAFSVLGALVFAAVAITAAVPVTPIA